MIKSPSGLESEVIEIWPSTIPFEDHVMSGLDPSGDPQ